jgi:hypothetical protein
MASHLRRRVRSLQTGVRARLTKGGGGKPDCVEGAQKAMILGVPEAIPGVLNADRGRIIGN